MDEEEKVIDIERRLVGRQPFKYKLESGTTTLEADSGFGKVGAKMDPKTGALMYEKYEDWITKQKTIKEEIAESNIRFSDDSSAIIHFREKEDLMLSPEGGIIDHKARGQVSVENISDKDRMWDIAVDLKPEGPENLMDFSRLEARELDPGKRHGKDYTFDLPGSSMALEELISTHPDFPESKIITAGKSSHTNLQLGIKNLHTIPYRDVRVTKAVPEVLKNIIFPGEENEDVKIEDGKLLWNIPRIEPNEIRILRYEGDVEVDRPDRIPTGDVEVMAKADDLITPVVVDNFEAMCRNMYFIEADETEEPGEWICRFVVENTSHFEVEVIRVEVKDPTTGEIFLNMDEPGINVPPEGRWESDSWVIGGSDRPSFIKNLLLNVVPGLRKEMTFNLHKEGGDFHPTGLSFRKIFSRNKVEANRETEIDVSLTVENTGDAELEQLFLRDLLPKFLTVVSPSSITVERDGRRLQDNVGVHLESEDEGPFGEQQLFIRIDDLSSYGGPLSRSERVAIRYKAVVFRPDPDITIESPAEVDARPYLPGPVISGNDVAGTPVIKTHQVLRRFSVGKSIEQGSGKGEYNIQLLYRNRGNQVVSDLILKDIIPENFTGLEYSREPAKEATPEGITVLKWAINKVEPGESLVLSYSIKGEGEYHARDAQIFYNATSD